MLSHRVVVTGLGAVSCFGQGVGSFWRGLSLKATGQAQIKSFDASSYRSDVAAELPAEVWLDAAAFEAAGRPEEEATLLATLAAREAIEDAGIGPDVIRDAGCVVGTLCSSSRVFERYGRLFSRLPATKDETFPDPDACMVAFQLEHLVRHFELGGPATLISTACSSSTDAIGYAADFIKNGDANVMLAGGADILSEFVHAGFNTVFSITKDKPRPFDTTRSGFMIGEGAGIVILERLEHALARGANIYAEVLGYGLSNTAYHLTATSEDGSGEALAVERCLIDAGVQAADVDYVNAHGTATTHNDMTESKAFRSIFGDTLADVAISSIKANIGHCMGASGALEAIATIKSIEEGRVPPTLNSMGDLDGGLAVVVDRPLERKIDYAISQSFGFGGACSAILFAAPQL